VDDSKLGRRVSLFGSKATRARALIELPIDWADHYSAQAMYLRLERICHPRATKNHAARRRTRITTRNVIPSTGVPKARSALGVGARHHSPIVVAPQRGTCLVCVVAFGTQDLKLANQTLSP